MIILLECIIQLFHEYLFIAQLQYAQYSGGDSEDYGKATEQSLCVQCKGKSENLVTGCSSDLFWYNRCPQYLDHTDAISVVSLFHVDWSGLAAGWRIYLEDGSHAWLPVWCWLLAVSSAGDRDLWPCFFSAWPSPQLSCSIMAGFQEWAFLEIE